MMRVGIIIIMMIMGMRMIMSTGIMGTITMITGMIMGIRTAIRMIRPSDSDCGRR
jgi:hypothetical protein